MLVACRELCGRNSTWNCTAAETGPSLLILLAIKHDGQSPCLMETNINYHKLSMNGYDSVMFLELDGRLERGSGFQVTFSEFVMLTANRLPAEHSRPAMRQAALQPQRHQRGINMINYSLKILPVCCLACLQDISLPYARSCCQHPRHLNFTLLYSWKPIRNRISPLIKFHSVPLFKFLLKLT